MCVYANMELKGEVHPVNFNLRVLSKWMAGKSRVRIRSMIQYE